MSDMDDISKLLHPDPWEQLRAVERGEAPSGSAVVKVTGPRSLHTPGPRYCFHADESYYDAEANLYHVIKVVEGEAGYLVWGMESDLDDAKGAAKHFNTRLGLSDEDVLNIRISSMRESRR